MYPHFIEVTCELGDDEHRTIEKRLVNVDNIVVVSDNVIDCGKDGIWYTEETYDELKELISNAGASINKGDPRLDQTKPLTMKDIEEMKSGEPVWNSNRDEWYLLRTMTEDGEVWFSDFVGSKVIATEEMLIKTPLYRMKRNEDRIYIPDGYVREKLGSKNHE